MKLRLKENPKEWRKSTLLSLGGVVMLSSLLCWRRILGPPTWLLTLAATAGIAFLACVQPHWFRRYYRFSTRVGFWLSQVVARLVLILIFLLLITPLGLLLRTARKDLLRLKRSGTAATYWTNVKPSGSLDQLF